MTKAVWAFLVSTVVSFFAPVEMLLWPVVWLIIIDILTGIYHARMIAKQPITSRGLFRKVPQITMSLVALVAALHANPFFVTFGLPEWQAAKLVIAFYGLYELFSILENLGKMGLPIAKQIINVLSAKLPDEVKKELVAAEQDKQPEQS